MASSEEKGKNAVRFITCLEQLSGDNAKKKFPLRNSLVIIGRHPKSDIIVNSPSVSRTHCTLSCQKGKWTIKDNNSQNGTFVNSEFLKKDQVVTLSTTDLIFLGPPTEDPIAFLFDEFVEEKELIGANVESATADVPLKVDDRGSELPAFCLKQELPEIKQESLPAKIQVEEISQSSQSLLDAESANVLSRNSYPFSVRLDDSNQEGNESVMVVDSPSSVPCEASEKSKLNESTVLKSKLESLSEEIKELQRSRSDLQQEYEVMCKRNKLLDEKLAEQQKLREEMALCEMRIKNTVKNQMEEDLICNICTELLIKPTVLDCSHTFCEHCILLWKKTKAQCPICRNPIRNQTRVLVLDQFIDKTLESLTPEQKERRRKLVMEREAPKSKPPPRTPLSSRGRRRARRSAQRQTRSWRTRIPLVAAVPAVSIPSATVPIVSIPSVAIPAVNIPSATVPVSPRNRSIHFQRPFQNPVIEIIDLTRNPRMPQPITPAQAIHVADILLSSDSDTDDTSGNNYNFCYNCGSRGHPPYDCPG